MSGGWRRSNEPSYAGTIVQEFFQEVKEYAIFLLDADGNVASWNEGAERIKGYTREEILGRHFSVFYPDDTNSVHPESALSRAERNGSYEETGYRVKKDGTQIWVRVTIRALYDEDGGIDGFAKIVRDISETREYQQQLKQSRDRLERTEQLANVGGWELYFSPRELRLTDGARQLLGVPDEMEITIRDVASFFHEDDRELINNAIEQVRQNGEQFDLELRIITARGQKQWVQLRGEATDDGQAVRGAVKDVSARREREERLMVLNRVLRHNLRNNLNVVTGYANELKNELDELSLPSVTDDELRRIHDVLDDITGTTAGMDSELALLNQVLSAVDDFETQSAVQMTDRIIENAEDLISTGEKARTFEQTVKRDIEKSPVQLQDIVSDLQATYQRKHPHSTIRTIDTEEAVLGNKHLLRLAIGELVHNAIVHSTQQSPSVELETRRVSDERVSIAVRDDGPGIPKNEKEILRTGKETALTHGSGMGLWTVHWVITQLGGDVSITRRDADGSTVEVHLPAPRNDEK